jgi:hypothetical protein
MQEVKVRYFLPVCMSVRPTVRPSALNNSVPAQRMFIKFERPLLGGTAEYHEVTKSGNPVYERGF